MQDLQPAHLVLAITLVVLGLGILIPWYERRLARARARIVLLEAERASALDAVERAEHLAYHDALTGLANRKLFLDRLTVELARSKRKGEHVAVMFMDLDRFKIVNDSLGHAAGDRLLSATGDRISSCIRVTDTLARLGGDEFALLFPTANAEGAGIIAGKILAALRPPVHLADQDVYVTGSIGIAVFPEDGIDADALMRSADAAMYQAKEVGRNTFRFYRAAMNTRAATRLSLETALRTAVERDEFRLFYQPLVDCESGAVRRVEALIRWEHPDQGLLLPGRFLEAAEATGLIVDIGHWTLVAALEAARRWRDAGRPIPVTVNLAPRHFSEPRLVATIERMLLDAGVPPESLELEITESTALNNVERAAEVMKHLRELGVRISLDDFGAGYSAMNHLSRLPVDVLKLDQSFVRGAPHNRMDAAVVQAITHLAHSVGMEVVAEGVETVEQLAFVRGCGVDLAQGYLIAKPRPDTEDDAMSVATPIDGGQSGRARLSGESPRTR
jgi:diguanylate cyclase (GGDEF)-like protein